VNESELLVVGSIALDTLEGSFGNVTEELGGSAMYFALAASLIAPVRMVAPVGRDAVEALRSVIADRPIDDSGIEVVDAPTYRWRATQAQGRNIDRGSQDSIYDAWRPRVPPGFGGWAFVGSMRPDRQAQATAGLGHASLLAADSMLSYVHSQPAEARQVLERVNWYFCNQEEFLALRGDDPQTFRRRWSLDGLVVKAGPHGVTAYTNGGSLHVPALAEAALMDTTGAGDAIAGGMLARWMMISSGGEMSKLEEALVWGVACASITISGIGVRALAAATREDLDQRVMEVKRCLRPGS
jgi:sugar/nucleoside kinase (ribokinase family)